VRTTPRLDRTIQVLLVIIMGTVVAAVLVRLCRQG